MTESVNQEFPPENPYPQSFPPVDRRASSAWKIAIIFFALSVVASAVTSVALLNNKVDTYTSDYTEDYYDDTSTDSWESDDAWVPVGFTAWPDDYSVAYKYSTVNEYECSDYNCVEISFISEFGCSDGLYVAANYLDGPEGSVIGYDNASLPSLQSMQVAKLMFEDTSNTSTNWQISQISCN